MKDESNKPITSVIFRRWKDENKEPIAIFPYIPADDNWHVLSYGHIGQHGAASYRAILNKTKPATTQEPDVLSLYIELRQMGYRMKVVRRVQR